MSRTMTFEPSHQPRTGHTVSGPAPSSTDELDATIDAAAAAFAAVSTTAPAERRHWLNSVADALDATADELVALADEETALGVDRLSGELTRGADNVRYYGAVGEAGAWLHARVQRIPGPPAMDLRRASLPIGPVAVFGASNFPFQFGVLGHDTCSAIAAGCPVVAKAHPAHPRLSVRLGEVAVAALAAAGAPAAVHSVVVGFDAGTALVDHPAVAAVAFTGSERGGMALVERARRRPHPIPVYAEMGTVNPVLVVPGAAARIDEIAREFVGAFTLGAGQFCTKPGLMLAPKGSEASAVIARYVATTHGVWLLTEGIAAAYRDGIAALRTAGAEVLATGTTLEAGYAAQPTLLQIGVSKLQPGSPFLEECFGPVAIIAEYEHIDEAFDALRRLQPSLVATVYAGGEDDPDAARAVTRLATCSGRIVVDGPSTGVATVDAMHHGGPWPATSDARATSVGANALERFTRPVAFQNVPEHALPAPLQDADPWRVQGHENPVAAE